MTALQKSRRRGAQSALRSRKSSGSARRANVLGDDGDEQRDKVLVVLVRCDEVQRLSEESKGAAKVSIEPLGSGGEVDIED